MITEEQYINLLANQVSFFTYLHSLDDVPHQLLKNYENTRYELILQYNPVFVRMNRLDCEYLGCIEFESIDELFMLQSIACGAKPYNGNRVSGEIIKIDLFDEYFSEWFNLNYSERSIFTRIEDFNPESIKYMKFAGVAYEKALGYFLLNNEEYITFKENNRSITPFVRTGLV